MLNMYIRATGGLMGWLFFMVLKLVSPFIRLLCILFVVGGGLMFLMYLFAGFANADGFNQMISRHGFMTVRHAMFMGLGFALIGMSVLVYLEIKMDRMFLNLLYPDVEDDGVHGFRWLLNCLGVFAIFAAFSYGAYYYYHRQDAHYMFAGLDGIAVGFCLWLAVGVSLGLMRWFLRMGSEAFYVLGELVRRAWGILRRWGRKTRRLVIVPKKAKASMTDAEIAAAAKEFVEANKVVPFRKRG